MFVIRMTEKGDNPYFGRPRWLQDLDGRAVSTNEALSWAVVFSHEKVAEMMASKLRTKGTTVEVVPLVEAIRELEQRLEPSAGDTSD